MLSLLTALLGPALAAPLPCAPDGPAPTAVGTVADKQLDEISGLVETEPGHLWVLEDSGNPAELTELDPRGTTLRVVKLVGAENTDWEDLALGPCGDARCLYVADFGDNKERRPFVRILRLPVPEPGVTAARAEVLPYRYPDGPQNAEALVVDPQGRITVVTKRKDDTAKVYEVPASFGAVEPVTAVARGSLPVGAPGVSGPFARITGGSLTPDGQWLLLRGYMALWAFPREASGEGWDPAGRVRLPAASEPQGESVAWARDGYWQVSEMGDQPAPVVLYRRDCR